MSLISKLTKSLFNDLSHFEPDNIDEWRYPVEKSRAIKERIYKQASKRGFTRLPYNAEERLESILCRESEYESLYQLFDEHSRHILINVLRYRVLGQDFVRLPLGSPEYKQRRVDFERQHKKQSNTFHCDSWALNLYEVNGLRFHTNPLGLSNTFIAGQYNYRDKIKVERGDYVVDAGGCWGETALDFARVAEKVYTFEFAPQNLEILKTNLELNPELAKKIIVIESPVWNESTELKFDFAGPGTHIGQGETIVRAVTIDESIERADFIKMDVEGAELNALEGARETIKKYHPRLAISVYHKENDLLDISSFIREYGYSLYLDHFTMYGEETILFARMDK